MILQSHIPYDVTPRALPGVAPLEPDGWIVVDEAYAAQMAYRAELLATRRDAVLAVEPGAEALASEVLDEALAVLARRDGFEVTADQVQRPDGVQVAIDRDDPLGSLGRIIQEDICILEKQGDEHVLVAACLCFPASWTLAEKIGRPLVAIHDPVDRYDSGIAARVQRLFDGVQVGRPLWRNNELWYDTADLHQPRPMGQRRGATGPQNAPFLRSEKQSILRLPGSGAVVFSIHNYVVRNPNLAG